MDSQGKSPLLERHGSSTETCTEMNADEWAALDWQKPNRQLAAEAGKSVARVAEVRWRCGYHGSGKKLKFRNKKGAGSKPGTPLPPSAAIQCIAATAKNWLIISPDGEKWEAFNLRDFVRAHSFLFGADAEEQPTPSGRLSCRAFRGLYWAAQSQQSWKNWTVKQMASK